MGGLGGGRLFSEWAGEQFKAICNQVLNRMVRNVSGHTRWGGGGAQRTKCAVWIGEKSSAIGCVNISSLHGTPSGEFKVTTWQMVSWSLETLGGSDLSEDTVSWV